MCVICYVLPSSEEINTPASNVASSTYGQTEIPPSSVSPLDILVDAVDDVCVAGSAAGPAATAVFEDVNKSTPVPGPEQSVPTVSPYLSTLFPSHRTNSTTNTASAATTPVIDYSTPACLESLSVHPVTALVRRMPALAETYQTIKKVQETYHSASTAQKKRDIKAANQKEKSNKKNNDGKKKNHYQKNKPTLPLTDAVNTKNSTEPITTTNTSGPSISSAEQDDYLLTADSATLSGRQKRVAKYLQKAQTQQKTAVILPQSKQMKERRDHRENRSKTMSNKNQSLLDLMQGGEKKYTSASSEGNIDSISGEADSAVYSAVARVNAGEENDTEMQTNDGIVDSANHDASTGTKRKYADRSDTNDEGSFWSIAQLFNPIAPASGTDVLGPNKDAVTLSTSNATGTGDSTSGALDSMDETNTVRCKRFRTKYEQERDGATNGETNSGYMDRAVKHCIIL